MLKRIVVLLYLLGALFVWIGFRNAPPDGLANVGIALYTLPIFLVGNLILPGEFPFVGGDYYSAHTKYFIGSVLVIAVMIYVVVLSAEKAIRRYKRYSQK